MVKRSPAERGKEKSRVVKAGTIQGEAHAKPETAPGGEDAGLNRALGGKRLTIPQRENWNSGRDRRHW